MKELALIQARLNAPKNQRNNFGKYNYRSCEDILEALKPLLREYECVVTLSDDFKALGNVIYIESTATITNKEKESVSVTAQAGVDLNRKGMDIAQSFGSSSSYSRKYACNGLFCIDDNKEPDATNTHGKERQQVNAITPAQANELLSIAKTKNAQVVEQVKSFYKITNFAQTPANAFDVVKQALEGIQ